MLQLGMLVHILSKICIVIAALWCCWEYGGLFWFWGGQFEKLYQPGSMFIFAHGTLLLSLPLVHHGISSRRRIFSLMSRPGFPLMRFVSAGLMWVLFFGSCWAYWETNWGQPNNAPQWAFSSGWGVLFTWGAMEGVFVSLGLLSGSDDDDDE